MFWLGDITNMVFLKEMLDKLGFLLAAMQVTTHDRQRPGSGCRGTLTQSVGRYVLGVQLIRVHLRAVVRELAKPPNMRLGRGR